MRISDWSSDVCSSDLGARHGSEVLTAYILAASAEAAEMGLPFALPDASKRKMLGGLRAFAEGKIVRRRWAPPTDLDLRKLLVLDALSHHGQANPRMLASIRITPTRWPTSAGIDSLAFFRPDRSSPRHGTRVSVPSDLASRRTIPN